MTHLDALQGVHVVLASYHTVSAEWNTSHDSENGQSLLFSVKWRRIILDEGKLSVSHQPFRHLTFQPILYAMAVPAWPRPYARSTPSRAGPSPAHPSRTGSVTSRRCCRLSAPIRTLIRSGFDADISRLWKSGEDEKAATRLETLSGYLILRRPKAIIDLPKQHNLLYPVNLYPAERDLYNQIREQALVRIEEALCGDSDQARARVYINALQKIESLRLVCDLGLQYYARDTASNKRAHAQAFSVTDQWTREAQDVFNAHRNMKSVACVQCLSTLELMANDAGPGQFPSTPALFSQCLQFVCADCVKKTRQVGGYLACGHHPPCPAAPVSTSNAVLEEALDLAAPSGSHSIPSKVEALLENLKTLPPDTKWQV